MTPTACASFLSFPGAPLEIECFPFPCHAALLTCMLNDGIAARRPPTLWAFNPITCWRHRLMACFWVGTTTAAARMGRRLMPHHQHPCSAAPADRPAGTVITQKGRVQARKFSLCQHTVAGDAPYVRVPTEAIPHCFDATLFSDESLAQLDEGVANQAARLAAPGESCSTQRTCGCWSQFMERRPTYAADTFGSHTWHTCLQGLTP